jgi:predicted Zn-dependent protease
VVALRRAAAGSADDWSIARTLASALVADGRPDASRQLLLRWRALHPDDAEVHAHLARVEARSGNVNEAVAYTKAPCTVAGPMGRRSAWHFGGRSSSCCWEPGARRRRCRTC